MPVIPSLTFAVATPDDVTDIVAVRTQSAEALTRRHGRGHWSSLPSERGLTRALSLPRRRSQMLLARVRGRAVGVLLLATKKPWAIDPAYFTAVRTPLYLTDMAVMPRRQGEGIGRRLLDFAREVARAWPADAIRLDAYDADAGAGGFYAACGFTEVGRVTYRSVPLIYFEDVL